MNLVVPKSMYEQAKVKVEREIKKLIHKLR